MQQTPSVPNLTRRVYMYSCYKHAFTNPTFSCQNSCIWFWYTLLTNLDGFLTLRRAPHSSGCPLMHLNLCSQGLPLCLSNIGSKCCHQITFPFSCLTRLPNKAWAAFLPSPAFVLLAACAAPFALPALIPADAAALVAATYPASPWLTPPGLTLAFPWTSARPGALTARSSMIPSTN